MAEPRSTMWNRVKVHMAMTMVGMGYGGYSVLTKACFTSGISPFVFSVYRDGISCCVLFLTAAVLERQHWSKMSLKVAGLIFALAVIGVYFQQGLYLFGLLYTNVIFPSIMMNCIPVWTLLIAAFFRIEEIQCKQRSGQAKVLGILVCVSGATVLTLYKGPVIIDASTPTTFNPGFLLSSTLESLDGFLRGWGIDKWQLGAICLLGSSFSSSVFSNLQVPTLKRFPAPCTIMAGSTFLGCWMFAITAFFTVEGTWALSTGTDLIAAIYAGVVASGAVLYLQCWSNQKAGPLFVAAYTPIQPIFATIFGFYFLGEALYLGSLYGAALIFPGLYLVIWGQMEGRRINRVAVNSSPLVKPCPSLSEPLLGYCNPQGRSKVDRLLSGLGTTSE